MKVHPLKKTSTFFLSTLLAVSTLHAQDISEQNTPSTITTNVSSPYKYSGVVPMGLFTSTADGAKKPDEVLRIVSPVERHKDLALLAVGALLGSFRFAVSKDDYKGENIDSLKHPGNKDLFLGLAPLIDEWVSKNAVDRTFKNNLWTRLNRYQLVYRGTDDKPDYYDLKIEATIGRTLDSSNAFFSSPKVFTCKYVDDQSKTTLEDWQANNYAKVLQANEAFVADCLKTAQTNLPMLLAP